MFIPTEDLRIETFWINSYKYLRNTKRNTLQVTTSGCLVIREWHKYILYRTITLIMHTAPHTAARGEFVCITLRMRIYNVAICTRRLAYTACTRCAAFSYAHGVGTRTRGDVTAVYKEKLGGQGAEPKLHRLLVQLRKLPSKHHLPPVFVSRRKKNGRRCSQGCLYCW